MTRRNLSRYLLVTEQSLSWLLWATKPKALALRDFKPYLGTLQRVAETRGELALIAFSKAVRANVLNYLSGNPERVPGVRLTTKDGLPICLGPLLRVVREQGPEMRLVMTVLFSTRALRTEPVPDIEPIIAPLDKGASYGGLTLWAADFWKQLGYRHSGITPRALRMRSFHFTTKSGPNGHALATWVTDLLSLPNRMRELITDLGGVKVKTFLETCLGWEEGIKLLFAPSLDIDYVKSTGITRKISYFPDREGKTRVIAIGDYFSQAVLRPLHLYLFRVLKKIPQDCTFNQAAFFEKLKGAEYYYSVDLTAATDRFPIQVISAVLAGHLPTSYVKSWAELMVGFPFVFRQKGQPEKSISYSVGNPMGFYSSWASFSLCHHYIVYYCCRMLNKDWSSLPYCLLGDDIVIGDKEVGELYLKVIGSLGVKVSMAKTHRSKTTLEFAKRWIHNGQEITPFPISAMKEASRSVTSMTTLLLTEKVQKGWAFQEDVDSMVRYFFGTFRSLPSRVTKKKAEESYVAGNILQVIWGTLPAGEACNLIARRLSISLPLLSDTVGMNILANIMVELFSDSYGQMTKQGGKPLGDLAIDLVTRLTDVGQEDERAMVLLANPLLQAYGSIETTYVDLLRKAKEIDTIHAGEWPLLLKAMTIPLSDDVFSNRQEHVESVAVSRVGKKLRERLLILKSFPQLLA
ncbi:RNA-dependent RNA polymerase [Botryosphaeria dothidea mitovirus 3]|nr:RNA-dependent RNA polymerase [Botryosphaeria dothidea mitovirus 3]